MSLLIFELISESAISFWKLLIEKCDVYFTSMYLSVRLPDFEYASDIKYGKWSVSEVNNIPAIE